MPKAKSRRVYPKCREHRDGRHRFGTNNMSFTTVCCYRDEDDIDDMCTCGFNRKEWKSGVRAQEGKG